MVKVKNYSIEMTKGDSLYIEVGITDAEGNTYTPQVGDEIKFGVKLNEKQENLLIEKVIPNDTLLLHLTPEDTKTLAVGKYVYDIQLTFANGDVDTFINKQDFKLVAEVI